MSKLLSVLSITTVISILLAIFLPPIRLDNPTGVWQPNKSNRKSTKSLQ